MARNNLTDGQELLIRGFLDGAVKLNLELSNRTTGDMLMLLGYKVLPNGACVAADTEIKTRFGDPEPFAKYEDLYVPEGVALRKKVHGRIKEEALRTVREDQADPSEPTKGN